MFLTLAGLDPGDLSDPHHVPGVDSRDSEGASLRHGDAGLLVVGYILRAESRGPPHLPMLASDYFSFLSPECTPVHPGSLPLCP